MAKWTLIFVPLLAGCLTSDADVLTIADRSGLGVEVGYAVTSGSYVPGGGDDKLKVGQVCPVCSGKGKVGDGTVFVDCHTCGGDGRIDEPDLKPSEDSFGAAPKPEVRTLRKLTDRVWTFEDYGTNPPASVKATHLERFHNIDTTGMTSSQMSTVHNNLHATGMSGLSSDETVTQRSSSGATATQWSSGGSSCPSGSCPSGSTSGSSRTRGVFGGVFRRR